MDENSKTVHQLLYFEDSFRYGYGRNLVQRISRRVRSQKHIVMAITDTMMRIRDVRASCCEQGGRIRKGKGRGKDKIETLRLHSEDDD